VGLLYQLYGIFNIVAYATYRYLPWWLFAIIAFNVIVYVAGLIVFARSEQRQVVGFT
jgi:hypothetical protein